MNKAEIKTTEQVQPKNQTMNVLIIDNDQQSVRLLLEILAHKGIQATVANNNKAAIDLFDKDNYNLVFASVETDGCGDQSNRLEDSFELLAQIRSINPELPVIMMEQTHQCPEIQRPQLIADRVVKAVNAGCCDFMIKPLNRKKVEYLLDTFIQNHTLSIADSAQQGTQTLYEIVGKSAKLRQTLTLAKKMAPTSAPVLVSGESGTGKELVSFLIHHHSKRSRGRYVRVNCAALSDSLLESELFGHEKGAFTGAYARRKGRFETAHGGTLLLDEITETPLRFQAKLLRVLEQQDFERVGGSDSIRVNVRIISTTNKDLWQEVAEGRFRQDLYYRLSGIRLIIPPLRERCEDLPDLVWYFVNFYAQQAQRHITKLDPAMMDIFQKYHWPGNVRQLRNVVLTSLILGTGQTLSLADVSWLFDELQPLPQERKLSITNGQSASGLAGIPLVQVERQAILDTLEHTSGNQTKAAKILGISGRTLRDKIRRYRHKECLQLV